MRVTVDPARCRSAALCVKKVPSIFRFEAGSKKAVAIEGDVPTRLEGLVMEAAGDCPTRAIRIEL